MNYRLKDIYVNIRPANINDIDRIMEIEPEAFGKHHWSKQSFTNEFSGNYSRYFIAETEEEPKNLIGYIGYWMIQDEGHITTLAVSPFYKRNHIADILLYTLINDSYQFNIKWLTLEVRSSNIPAINLYKKYRFKQLGIRKNYYQDNNEDALILWTENINNEDYLNEIEKNISLFLGKELDADKYQYSTK